MKKILYINLNDRKARTINQYDKCRINLNADNLVFEAPPLAGYGIVGLNRLSVYDKNSLSTSGSHFAHFMKCNGYDYLVFEGESDVPVYVYINKENISINDAIHLSEADFLGTQKILKKELHINKIEIASVGIAGMKNIDFAKIMLRNNKSCGSDGLGKLMANKNLKAIVLRHQENLIPYDGENFKKHNQIIAKRITSDNKKDWYDENNNCYGCCLNCKNTVVDKIKKYGFTMAESENINKISNFYGMDSITLARGINKYKNDFDTEIIDLDHFVQNIINNYDYYKPLFINESKRTNEIRKKSKDEEKLGFCKILLEKNILTDKEKKSLIKSILGLSMAI